MKTYINEQWRMLPQASWSRLDYYARRHPLFFPGMSSSIFVATAGISIRLSAYPDEPSSDETATQYVSLNEEVYEPADVPFAALLGRFDPTTGDPSPLLWSDPITENPGTGETHLFEILNVTEDAHPIHIHLVQFEVIGREAIGGGPSVAGSNDPLPWETGFKDTVIAYPGEITRVKARFDTPGFYVWHCHIVEHEDNEMMRPFHVRPIPPDAPVQ